MKETSTRGHTWNFGKNRNFFEKKKGGEIGKFHAMKWEKLEFLYGKKKYFHMKKEKKNSIFLSNEMRGKTEAKNKIQNCQTENK